MNIKKKYSILQILQISNLRWDYNTMATQSIYPEPIKIADISIQPTYHQKLLKIQLNKKPSWWSAYGISIMNHDI